MTEKDILHDKFKISSQIIELAEEAENAAKSSFSQIEAVARYNQLKVLDALQENKIGDTHFTTTTGYGYNDVGRDAIDRIFAQVFECEDALVRIQFVSGTHAINVALSSILRPGDTIMSITGKPYDTLEKLIGIKNSKGSFKEFGIEYVQIELGNDGKPDKQAIASTIARQKIKAVLIQKSRGYTWRSSLSTNDIKEIISYIKSIDPQIYCIVDNCYGEFVETIEPSAVGADLVVGSLIKNPGGGVAPTGAYICGTEELVELAAYRLTSPGLGKECGPSLGFNKTLLQGLFLAPSVVGEALKGAVFAANMLKSLGYEVSPLPDEQRYDIIQAIKFNNEEILTAFCQGIQKGSPVDSHVTPYPWDMPGYENKVIMAAGAFTQGSSIELSADAPIIPPYILYLQGGLTYCSVKLGILKAVQQLKDGKLWR